MEEDDERSVGTRGRRPAAGNIVGDVVEFKSVAQRQELVTETARPLLG